MTFEQALANSEEKRHLLLGNGFSVACDKDIFTYGSLFERADFGKHVRLKAVFDALKTTNFEEVIRVLQQLVRLASTYGIDTKTAAQISVDAGTVKEILVQSIAKNHPNHPFEIDEDRYKSCRAFLRKFKSIYTLNYDLLLYWALMRNEEGEWIDCDDGFRHPDDVDNAEYVSWLEHNSANIHFLHGALHLFDADYEVRKYTWSRTEVHLMEQIRSALAKDFFPLFVAEGISKNKLTKILHNAYLHKGLRSLEANCATIKASFFIYGHSLNDNDEHVFRALRNGRTKSVFVSLYGDPASPTNKAIIRKVEAWKASRDQYPLATYYFDAQSAKVWG